MNTSTAPAGVAVTATPGAVEAVAWRAGQPGAGDVMVESMIADPLLVTRRHVDYMRVFSAVCRFTG